MRTFSAIALLLMATSPFVRAQRAAGFARAGGGISSSHGVAVAGFHPSPYARFGRGFARQPIFLGWPWFSDYEPAVTAAPQPAVFLVENPPPTAPAEDASPVRPLLIEWRGDRFVRFGGASKATDQPDYAETGTVKLPPAAAEHPVPPPPASQAVLVYRDGHQERLAGYTITSGVLYARGDYWTDGYWVKSIRVAALDLPATVQANLGRGVHFVLPSAPNEVVVGP
jgi:hypothetical protein